MEYDRKETFLEKICREQSILSDGAVNCNSDY